MTDRPGKLRIVIDAGLSVSVLGLAFYAGVMTQQIADLKEAVSTRGRVQISIEASNRLTALETNDHRQDMRLLAIEEALSRGGR